MPFAATRRGQDITIQSEVSQIQKDKYNITYMQTLKKLIQVNLFMKQDQKPSHKNLW